MRNHQYIIIYFRGSQPGIRVPPGAAVFFQGVRGGLAEVRIMMQTLKFLGIYILGNVNAYIQDTGT